MKYPRVNFVICCSLVLIVMLASCVNRSRTKLTQLSGQSSARVQPDILLLMPDQMRGDCLSVLGHPVVRTPNFDELAKQGVLFRRAYATVPSCIPARYALLTGLFPQSSGVVGFKAKPITHPTLPQLLNRAGYATVLVGRIMHQTPHDEPYGYEKKVLGSTYESDDEYDNFLRKAAPESGGIRNVINTLKITSNNWLANPWPLDDSLHPTAWVSDQACKVLKESAADRPLFLTASFYSPHPPLFPPKKIFDDVLSRNLPSAAHGDWVDWKSLSSDGDKAGHRILLEGEALRRAQAGYFGLIEHVDSHIEPIVRAFKARAQKAGRTWVIAVISDHGEMLGDHGFFRKCEPYEGSANIPFIIVGSSELGFKKGLRNFQPVCLEDIMPTFLDVAGATIPKPMDGVSLLPTLRKNEQTIRECLHFEHAPCYSKEQAFHALTDGKFKYIWRPLDGTEHLFDLTQDIQEARDLSKSSQHRDLLKQWRGRLVARLAGRPEGFSDGIKLIPGRPYPPLQEKND